MLEVGTMPKPDSSTLGKFKFIFASLNKIEFLLDTIPIKKILYDFANLIIFFNSFVFPELLIKISISFLVILPRSPCEQSLAETVNEGVPTEDNVAEILDAIIPLFPTPQTITLDRHLIIALTALLKLLSITFF